MKRVFQLIWMVFFLSLISCLKVQEEPQNIPHIFWPDVKNIARWQPVHLSIDKDFSKEQNNKIAQAMVAWEVASSNKVLFAPVWNVEKPGKLQQLLPLKLGQGIFLWDLPKNPENVHPLMINDWKELDGLTIFGPGENSAHVIIYEVPENIFYQIALHELGHLLGLNHIREISVMHENAKSSCITKLDAIQLCELYGCQPKPSCP